MSRGSPAVVAGVTTLLLGGVVSAPLVATVALPFGMSLADALAVLQLASAFLAVFLVGYGLRRWSQRSRGAGPA